MLDDHLRERQKKYFQITKKKRPSILALSPDFYWEFFVYKIKLWLANLFRFDSGINE
jgi:predicted transcriptional regulator